MDGMITRKCHFLVRKIKLWAVMIVVISTEVRTEIDSPVSVFCY